MGHSTLVEQIFGFSKLSANADGPPPHPPPPKKKRDKCSHCGTSPTVENVGQCVPPAAGASVDSRQSQQPTDIAYLEMAEEQLSVYGNLRVETVIFGHARESTGARLDALEQNLSALRAKNARLVDRSNLTFTEQEQNLYDLSLYTCGPFLTAPGTLSPLTTEETGIAAAQVNAWGTN
ncbi:hypothetical protein DTO271G3_1711 [Paecilomyces variotii]|nr:hypothetical protein DTO271G3_1711 [Paecilomyces variotii]